MAGKNPFAMGDKGKAPMGKKAYPKADDKMAGLKKKAKAKKK